MAKMTGSMFTLGIEEEFQIVDPTTRDLSPRNAEIIKAGVPILGDRIKPEMLMSCVETVTGICANITEAREQLRENRLTLAELTYKQGVAIAGAGTHPFGDWMKQPITDHERYIILEEELQDVIREILIFGMHVHVGIPDRDLAVSIMNELRYFLPHILALSTSSPFWMGRNTGLKSFRSIVFQRFPRTGIPDEYSSAAEFDKYINMLTKTRSVDDGKKIWWDIRPHPIYSTIEIRICDMPTRIDETLALAAIIQAVAYKLYRLKEQNLGWRSYSRALIMENKWRAIRYGLDGKLIDFGKEEEVPARDLMHELVAFVDDVVDELGSRRDVEYIEKIVRDGTSADRQLATFAKTNDTKAVVDQLLAETMENV